MKLVIVTEDLAGAGGFTSTAGKLVLEVGGSLSPSSQTCVSGLMAWQQISRASNISEVFYDKASEILHGHFYHILLDTQANSNLVWKGQHKHIKPGREDHWRLATTTIVLGFGKDWEEMDALMHYH